MSSVHFLFLFEFTYFICVSANTHLESSNKLSKVNKYALGIYTKTNERILKRDNTELR